MQLNPQLANLPVYQPGRPLEEVARELGLPLGGLIKLASNENPLGPSPKAVEAMQQTASQIHLYPDGNAFYLRNAMAERLGVDANQLIFGNGSNEIIEFVAHALLGPGTNIVVSQYCFAIYPIVAHLTGADCIAVPAKDYGHNLPAMREAITPDTRIVFVANPNNPTGTVHTADAIEAVLNRIPENVLVVLDEAYCEYLTGEQYPDGVELLARFPNLIVCRTFSKAWGLAALRVGYSISSPAIADILNRVRQPFNVDTVALSAATAVLEDEDYLQRSRDVNTAGLRQLQEAFDRMGLSYIPSAGNFVAVEVGEQAMGVYQSLLAHGVIVRPIGGYGMPRHLRVSVGLPEENERFIDALAQALAASGLSD